MQLSFSGRCTKDTVKVMIRSHEEQCTLEVCMIPGCFEGLVGPGLDYLEVIAAKPDPLHCPEAAPCVGSCCHYGKELMPLDGP